MPGTELEAPSINAAFVRPVTETGVIFGKASGMLVAVADDLYLLTNWHVATGRRWMTPEDQAAWHEKHGSEIAWASENDRYSPHSLDISIPLSGRLLRLARIDMDATTEVGDDLIHAYAWDNADDDPLLGMEMPSSDVVCLHLSKRPRHWSGVISGIASTQVRLGYDANEIGMQHAPQVGDQVFVVGYGQAGPSPRSQ